MLISSFNKIAIIYQELSKYDTAAVYKFKILILAEELEDDSFIGITANNLSFLFEKMQQYSKSEAFGRQALSLGMKTCTKRQTARVFGNIAGFFEYIKRYHSAISYYNNAIKVLKKKMMWEHLQPHTKK